MILSNFNKTFRNTDTAELVPVPLSHGYESVTNCWMYNSGNRNSCVNFANIFPRYDNRNYMFQSNSSSYDAGGYYVAVGYGNASESADDYKLADMQGVDSDLLSHKYGYNKSFRGDSDYPIWVESVYENTGSTNVTVKEIGLVYKAYLNSWSGGSWLYTNYLIARKVLANPVTIHPNEVYKFIYKLKF